MHFTQYLKLFLVKGCSKQPIHTYSWKEKNALFYFFNKI